MHHEAVTIAPPASSQKCSLWRLSSSKQQREGCRMPDQCAAQGHLRIPLDTLGKSSAQEFEKQARGPGMRGFYQSREQGRERKTGQDPGGEAAWISEEENCVFLKQLAPGQAQLTPQPGQRRTRARERPSSFFLSPPKKTQKQSQTGTLRPIKLKLQNPLPYMSCPGAQKEP